MMSDSSISNLAYPVYRCYVNDRACFKILSESEFVELKSEGNQWNAYNFSAKIYPDRLLIQDMIACKDGFWRESDASEFNALFARITGN